MLSVCCFVFRSAEINDKSEPFTDQLRFWVRICFFWRRERDSNPRYAINVNTISSRAPSAKLSHLSTQPISFYAIGYFPDSEYKYSKLCRKIQAFFSYSAVLFCRPTRCISCKEIKSHAFRRIYRPIAVSSRARCMAQLTACGCRISPFIFHALAAQPPLQKYLAKQSRQTGLL